VRLLKHYESNGKSEVFLRITSWNINGLRSIIKGKYDSFFYENEYNVICLQEVKMQEDLLTSSMFHPKDSYWNTAVKSGYSGVTTIVNPNLTPVSIKKGIGDIKLDNEGRVLTTEFELFILVNVYAPHSHRKLLRLDVKELFFQKFISFIHMLRESNKPIIIVGDLNVAHQEIDIFHYKVNNKNAGFLPQERQWMTDLLSMGFIDAFRYLYPENKEYSWWGLMHDLREKNIGWRIDYILVDTLLKDKIKDCFYSKEQFGSDHCPVSIDIDI
jgi:exodeoxyribonuclease III